MSSVCHLVSHEFSNLIFKGQVVEFLLRYKVKYSFCLITQRQYSYNLKTTSMRMSCRLLVFISPTSSLTMTLLTKIRRVSACDPHFSTWYKRHTPCNLRTGVSHQKRWRPHVAGSLSEYNQIIRLLSPYSATERTWIGDGEKTQHGTRKCLAATHPIHPAVLYSSLRHYPTWKHHK